MQDKPIKLPAGYAPAFAVGIADQDGNLAMVGNGTPLPVMNIASAPAATPPTPLSGSTATNLVTGPFTPLSEQAINLTLSGTWEGKVKLLRSVDDGATLHPLTVGGRSWAEFSANVCEPVWIESEAGAGFYLDIALTSGSVDYRVSQ